MFDVSVRVGTSLRRRRRSDRRGPPSPVRYRIKPYLNPPPILGRRAHRVSQDLFGPSGPEDVVRPPATQPHGSEWSSDPHRNIIHSNDSGYGGTKGGVQVGKGGDRRNRERQVGALVYRFDASGRLQVLVITSRQTHRPVIPKGWRMKGVEDSAAAAREAFQEAGIEGRCSKKPIGRYRYWKRLPDHFALVTVKVFALEARTILEDFKESSERLSAWLSPSHAAVVVQEPGLSKLIEKLERKLDPSSSSRGRKDRRKHRD